MDMLVAEPPLDLNNRSWIIHTRTEERPPAQFWDGAQVTNSMISDGCVVESGAVVERSILSPGVRIKRGAVVRESIILTDGQIDSGATVRRAILDKRVRVGANVRIGDVDPTDSLSLSLVGKNSQVPPGYVIEPGGVVGTDVIDSDYPDSVVLSGQTIQTKRLPYEI